MAVSCFEIKKRTLRSQWNVGREPSFPSNALTTQHSADLWSVQLLSTYLEVTRIVEYTDYHALKWIIDLVDAPRELG